MNDSLRRNTLSKTGLVFVEAGVSKAGSMFERYWETGRERSHCCIVTWRMSGVLYVRWSIWWSTTTDGRSDVQHSNTSDIMWYPSTACNPDVHNWSKVEANVRWRELNVNWQLNLLFAQMQLNLCHRLFDACVCVNKQQFTCLCVCSECFVAWRTPIE